MTKRYAVRDKGGFRMSYRFWTREEAEEAKKRLEKLGYKELELYSTTMNLPTFGPKPKKDPK